MNIARKEIHKKKKYIVINRIEKKNTITIAVTCRWALIQNVVALLDCLCEKGPILSRIHKVALR